ncbi:MAG TPA: hypothetical protein PKV98_13490 [Burkholderiaceae bacterium]|nr:hypothetical protein [Burkholderiaceae bacterium]
MNWLYLIPVVCLIGLACYAPGPVVIAVIGVVAACLGALWLTDIMRR